MNWIKTTDKLPNLEQIVFTFGSEGMRLCIYTDRLGFLGRKVGQAKFCNMMSKFKIPDENVKYWMPLPKPPID